mgnify:CR=1 FL=1
MPDIQRQELNFSERGNKMNWIKKALSEADGAPSSQRLMAIILLIFTMNLLACGFYAAGGLPNIPESLSDLIKWLFTAVITGVGVGKVQGIVQAIKTPSQPDQQPGV